MTTRTCRECTTAFAVGLPACPHCESTDHEETGMPKITVHGGPSNADEEKEWPGTPSSPSTETPPTQPETSEPEDQKPVPKTEQRSGKGRRASSTARSGRASTSGPETDGEASASPDEGGED